PIWLRPGLRERELVHILALTGGRQEGGTAPLFQNSPPFSGTLGAPWAQPFGSLARLGDLGEDALTRSGEALADGQAWALRCKRGARPPSSRTPPIFSGRWGRLRRSPSGL